MSELVMFPATTAALYTDTSVIDVATAAMLTSDESVL